MFIEPGNWHSSDDARMSRKSLKPQFFVTRQNGNMVPLIAMDELPSTIGIRNVSRSLSPYDISGMTGIGTYESRHLNYVVDTPETYNKSALVDRSLMASRYAKLVDHHLTSPSVTASLYQAPPKAYGIQEQAPASPLNPMAPSYPASCTSTPVHRGDRNASPVQQPLPQWKDTSALPTKIRSAPGVKEYCSYWLRNGECDYAQQGCLYKHEMPLDRATLERLGHRDIPKWYREKHGLGSYHAVSGTLGVAEESAGARKYNKPEMNNTSWRRGDRTRRVSQGHGDMDGLRSSVGRMGINGHGRDDVRRTMRADGPACPPSTPQMTAQQPIPASTYFANVDRNSNKTNTGRRQIHIQARPMETMQQQQTRQTLADHERYEREQKHRLSVLARMPTDANTSKLIEVEDRPTTAGSSSASVSIISARSTTPNLTPVDIGTPGEVNTAATSTENSASDSENTNVSANAESPKSILDSPVHEPKTPVLKPSVGDEAVRTPRSTPSSARRGAGRERRVQGRRGAVDAGSGRRSAGRRRSAAESEGDVESVGRRSRGSVSGRVGGRKGSLAGSVGGSIAGSAKGVRRGGKGKEKVREKSAKKEMYVDGYDHSD